MLIETHSKLFSKREKNVPSCSTSFQRELKPLANLLQSILNFYNIRDKSIEERSNNSRSRSTNAIKGHVYHTRDRGGLKASKTVKDLCLPAPQNLATK